MLRYCKVHRIGWPKIDSSTKGSLKMASCIRGEANMIGMHLKLLCDYIHRRWVAVYYFQRDMNPAKG